MSRAVTALIAALTLVVGFAVAQATGSQLLGGAVLLAGALWCVLREARRTPWWRIAVVVAVAAVAFGASHALADVIGPWPAVLVAAAVTGLSALGLLAPRGGVTARAPRSRGARP